MAAALARKTLIPRVATIAAAQDVVIPRWWRGEWVRDPETFQIDGGGKLTSEDCKPDSALGQEVAEKYAATGLVHVKNTGLSNMKDQRDLAKIVLGNETEYEGGANPRGRASNLANVYDIGAPLTADLHYHHEMTYKTDSVESIAFLCRHAVPNKGWSFVSDSEQAHDAIMQTDLGQKLRDKGLCFIRRMTDDNAVGNQDGTVYNSWQKSWMTNDPDQAEAAARAQGLQVEWIKDTANGLLMQTRYYISAFEYVASIDRNIMVTSIADDGEWFDSWPGICDIPQEDRPLEMLFGDDTEITLSEKQLWTDCYDDYGIPLQWEAGDVAVIDNMLYAHGRPGIYLDDTEQRELGVMLGPLYQRRETVDGKW